jgi:hypothetical protein
LPPKEETAIADLAKEAASLRARADVQERALAMASDEIITQFIAGDLGNFTISTPADAG